MANPSEGLVYAHCIGKDGQHASLSDWTDVDAWEPNQGLLWIHLDANKDEAKHWLTDKSGLPPLIQEALWESGSRPRSMAAQSEMLVILRGVNCNPGADPEDMVALRIFITGQRIISVRRNRVMAVQDIHEKLISGAGPTSAGEFFAAVVDRITERIGNVVTDIEDRVDEIEDLMLASETEKVRPTLSELRRESISIRRYIAPQRDMLSRLSHDRIDWISDEDRLLLVEAAERTARYVEDIDAARERALIAQEELHSRLSEQMNRAMYTLSIVAAIFLPLSLITGLLGINVGGIPGTDSPLAFIIVTLLLLVIAVILVVWFRKIKWL